MYVFSDKKKALKIAIFTTCLLVGLGFGKIYQPHSKTVKIYKQALTDYNNQNYSNSYYLFSKIGYTSSLKPIAIYRQSLCAKALGDKNSELKSYKALIRHYPTNKLAPESRYLAGQILIDNNPNTALRYFNTVLKSELDDDYKIAAKYYIARIAASKMRYSKKNNVFSKKKMAQIENSFRQYLEKYPDGRLATNVGNTWNKFNPNLNPKDAALIVRGYYYGKKYKELQEYSKKSKIEYTWAILAATAYSLNDFSQTKKLTEEGVNKYFQGVEKEDYNLAIDKYIDIFPENEQKEYLSKLLENAKGDKKDYIWNLKCEKSPQTEKYACYKDLYNTYPNGDYAENALLQMLLIGIKTKSFQSCKVLAKDFLAKYPESESQPLVMFWAGKLEQMYGDFEIAKTYYQNIINKYPDSYYAYRAYWLLKGVNSATINVDLDYKPVEYPYKTPDNQDLLYSLIQVQDYDMILKFYKDDFISSWVEYERGNYATSLILARDGMAKLKSKPPKSDLRWRLVYPQNYYRQVQNYAQIYNNNPALMMSIIREESSFNSEAQSGVGAIGLMQLMPSTAHDIGDKYGISFNTTYLFNPELNIKLGNLYYSTIREMLEGKDVSAIAAYNGGVGSVTKWKSSIIYNDTDEFVEQIPYDETKNYVIKVFRSYWNYIRIYQKQ